MGHRGLPEVVWKSGSALGVERTLDGKPIAIDQWIAENATAFR